MTQDSIQIDVPRSVPETPDLHTFLDTPRIRALAALRGAAGNAAYICRSGFGRHYACWCCTIQRGAHRGEMT